MLIKKDPYTIRSYFEDSSNVKGGHADEVVIPENIDEVVEFIKKSNADKTPVTISGGGTGTTGSRVPLGGKVLSLEKFNNIIDLSADNMCAIVEAGVLVEDLKRAAEDAGLFYTSHPTERTAFVGGTVATNASGSRSFKYGPTRKYVRRLKMVLSDGSIFEIRRGEKFISKTNSKIDLGPGRVIEIPLPSYTMPNIKNSAGYFAKDGMDLIDLFIGQEGTLSVITEVEMALVKKPETILSVFAFFKNEKDSLAFSDEARKISRDTRSSGASGLDALSIEYFDKNALELLRQSNPSVPIDAGSAIFFEQDTDKDGESAIAQRWLDLILANNGSADNTWVAMTENDANKFTTFRYRIPEGINEIVRKSGFQKLSTDIAVPVDKFSEMMGFYNDIFKEYPVRHVIFGHIGECHVHVNLFPVTEADLETARQACLLLIKKAVSLGGTVSAEHGIGKTRHKYLEIMYGKQGIIEMARIKKALDPNCILGLDNIFPHTILEGV